MHLSVAFSLLKEQIEWAVEEGADFILGETYGFAGEAMAALECIKKYGNGKHEHHLPFFKQTSVLFSALGQSLAYSTGHPTPRFACCHQCDSVQIGPDVRRRDADERGAPARGGRGCRCRPQLLLRSRHHCRRHQNHQGGMQGVTNRI